MWSPGAAQSATAMPVQPHTNRCMQRFSSRIHRCGIHSQPPFLHLSPTPHLSAGGSPLPASSCAASAAATATSCSCRLRASWNSCQA